MNDTARGESERELKEDIERTRERLGETVEALAAKADVRKQARHAADQMSARVKSKAREAAGSVRQLPRSVRPAGSVRSVRSVPPPAVAAAAAGTATLLLGYLVKRWSGR
ncbi:MAG: DUF3618 domain-containing protein [Streptosporangiaceae bacterium]|nr:DUF3618 domain-containing protein [Streptosporangiaceae bacterium]MBV9853007.1 DUF3618 domain-containing protein [Streptosporangiaceae bacterium]